MPTRDIPHYHEIIAKQDRPTPGDTYRWYLGEQYVFTATVTSFRGGCWAQVKIVRPAPEHTALYEPGAEIEIKVAHYRFEPDTAA
ncbi:MAG: hypothetical protein KatS3mg039_0450 [Candidatus Kapaibacterium sp.]|nr:MAG: hypothetical protein KatS3mg039_0450 [Candidatus Kapabacteria bacterium]